MLGIQPTLINLGFESMKKNDLLSTLNQRKSSQRKNKTRIALHEIGRDKEKII